MFNEPASRAQAAAKENYAAQLKAQVEEKKAAKAEAERARRAAEIADDARVVREEAEFKAQLDAEVSKQRAREALVAQREANAREWYAADRGRKPTLEERVSAYQAKLEGEAGEAPARPSPRARPPLMNAQPGGNAADFMHGARVAVRSEHLGVSDHHPSTRVSNAPGGRSSISLTDGSAAARPPAHEDARFQPPPAAVESIYSLGGGCGAPRIGGLAAPPQQPPPVIEVAPPPQVMGMAEPHLYAGGVPTLEVAAPPVGMAAQPYAPPPAQPYAEVLDVASGQQSSLVRQPSISGRPDLDADAAANANRARARGSTSLW